jgi:hypothetical protein
MRARTVDHNAIKFTQVGIAFVGAIAFIFNLWWLVGLLAIALLVGVAWPEAGAFRLIYTKFVLPRRWLRPNLLADDPAPHRFSTGVGGVFLSVGAGALVGGLSWLGWGLVGLVAALALVNVLFDFCAGCFIYYHLRRVGLIGRIPQAD